MSVRALWSPAELPVNKSPDFFQMTTLAVVTIAGLLCLSTVAADSYSNSELPEGNEVTIHIDEGPELLNGNGMLGNMMAIPGIMGIMANGMMGAPTAVGGYGMIHNNGMMLNPAMMRGKISMVMATSGMMGGNENSGGD